MKETEKKYNRERYVGLDNQDLEVCDSHQIEFKPNWMSWSRHRWWEQSVNLNNLALCIEYHRLRHQNCIHPALACQLANPMYFFKLVPHIFKGVIQLPTCVEGESVLILLKRIGIFRKTEIRIQNDFGKGIEAASKQELCCASTDHKHCFQCRPTSVSFLRQFNHWDLVAYHGLSFLVWQLKYPTLPWFHV